MSSKPVPNTKDATLSLIGTVDKLTTWSRLYDELLSRRRFQTGPPTTNHCLSHKKIVALANQLKNSVTQTREEFITMLLESTDNESDREELECSLDIAVQAMFMTDAVATTGLVSRYTYGDLRPSCWALNDTFVSFMTRTFSQDVDQSRLATMLAEQDSLRAWKLVSKLKVSFKGTNNLANHLLYDRGANTVYLFHHVGYLNAQLSGLAYDLDFESDMGNCLAKGTLPPRLLFETLHSLQSILFPPIGRKGHKMMDHLVTRAHFDPEFRVYSGYKHSDVEKQTEEVEYRYWGERLVILHDILRERPPIAKWEKWLQWQSSDANAFAVAILALLFSIMVGIVSIGLSAVQIWIAWKAWKYPVNK